MTTTCTEDFVQGLIDTLEADGVIPGDVAAAMRVHYLDPATLPALLSEMCTTCCKTGALSELSGRILSLFSLANFVKVVAISCLLCAAAAAIPLITPLLRAIPVAVVQVPLMVLAILGAIWPELFWPSQAVYVAIFSILLACMIGVWITCTQKRIQDILDRLIAAKWPLGVIGSALGMLLFGGLAVRHTSQLLGLLSAVCLSSVLGFGMAYHPHVLSLYVWRDSLSVVIYGHMAAVVAHLICKHLQLFPSVASLFGVGLECYCTIAMGVGFLIATSPFEGDGGGVGLSYKLGTLLVFIAMLSASMYAYLFLGTKTVGSILCVYAVLILLEYYMYFCSYGGYVFTMAAMAGGLYACALLVEKYRSFLVFQLNSEPI